MSFLIVLPKEIEEVHSVVEWVHGEVLVAHHPVQGYVESNIPGRASAQVFYLVFLFFFFNIIKYIQGGSNLTALGREVLVEYLYL